MKTISYNMSTKQIVALAKNFREEGYRTRLDRQAGTLDVTEPSTGQAMAAALDVGGRWLLRAVPGLLT